ncbi:hypothetical protein P3X46_018220 [Hevea brasiliensis]|uniref:Growth-regulating factor n=1 Tax=Hevea brasiliensis TaxID=3981 RepID=A0ABQ9LQ43_HEVBR|nr:vascular-related unknown protein 1 isoform X2 [Hevea brasiliensis]XP_057985221.1 vascular-related unknown protein 1 isoform X1 [Hevea brasiliensis]KAJ9170086.1 hypothetical protein P3X46_018220 [Hevea brasiliensis]
MEGSMNNSSMNREVVANSDERTTADDQESSGWTAYFEDFSNQRKEDSYCSGFGSSSMVSDAASFPAWKSSSSHHNYNHVLASCSPSTPNKLTFKKAKTRRRSHHDESLEDTASSPVNSPKVSDFIPNDVNPRKTNDHFNSSLGKGGALEHYGVVETDDERCEMSCSTGNKDCRDLKKKGLCLIPLSMLVNFLG